MTDGLISSPDELGEPRAFDTGTAHIARVYDYWLGGKDNYAADRAAGDEAYVAYPDMPSSVRANRAFLRRAVRFMAESGIRQFLDIGTGLPSANNTHEVAQSVSPDCRVLYVDNDPMVLAHARALLAGGQEGSTAYLDADARAPEKILHGAKQMLDLSQPVGVMLIAILHLVNDEDSPQQIAARLMQEMAPGSYLAITHVPSDMQASMGVVAAAKRVNRLMAQRINPRSRADVTQFFDGLELLPPGVVPIQEWRPDTAEEAAARAAMWGGVARKNA
jgi:S-adenosyl methyltransferase